MAYQIVTYRNGKARKHRFASLADARECAARIFDATGIVVGIDAVELV
jgi:hypothetical protein